MTSVGIDVSKGKSMVCLLKPYVEVLAAPYEVVHTVRELERLVSLIRSLEGEVRIVMEATGAYHLPLVSRFKEAGRVGAIRTLHVERDTVHCGNRFCNTNRIPT